MHCTRGPVIRMTEPSEILVRGEVSQPDLVLGKKDSGVGKDSVGERVGEIQPAPSQKPPEVPAPSGPASKSWSPFLRAKTPGGRFNGTREERILRIGGNGLWIESLGSTTDI